jgi:hypothetical protein
VAAFALRYSIVGVEFFLYLIWVNPSKAGNPFGTVRWFSAQLYFPQRLSGSDSAEWIFPRTNRHPSVPVHREVARLLFELVRQLPARANQRAGGSF